MPDSALKTCEEKRRHTEAALETTLQELRSCAARLEEANRELESFTYSVSHDLRAPLRVIDGFTEMILAQKGPDFDAETLRKFRIVRDNACKMGRLIEGLLMLSRLGRCGMNRGKLDMNFIARESLGGIRMEEPHREITAGIDTLPPAEGDPMMIRQVFDYLLSNSAKFTRDTPAARIEVGSIEKNGASVYFVKDNGIGFDMKHYDRLFNVFQRLVSESQFEGDGMGLALVRRIVKRHGGEIWAEAEVGKGATFYFTLAPGS